MGTSQILVGFTDGTVKHGTYDNTGDAPFPPLAASWKEALAAMDAWIDTDEEPEHTEPEVPVDIWCDYGGGSYWRGKARGGWLTDYGLAIDEKDGTPDWVFEYEASSPDFMVAWNRDADTHMREMNQRERIWLEGQRRIAEMLANEQTGEQSPQPKYE